MDASSSILDFCRCAWDCAKPHAGYICNFRENLNSLRDEVDKLKNRREDVQKQVNNAMQRRMRPKNEVEGWLEKAKNMEVQVDEILQQGYFQLENTCLGGCCHKNCWSSYYKLGKTVKENFLPSVTQLCSDGRFEAVAETPPLAPIDEIPCEETIGLDMKLSEVWSCLHEDRGGVIGIYGMGGVGKTALIKTVNNKFYRETTHPFDVVIWVVVSKDPIERVQTDIGRKLGLTWPDSVSRSARAGDIWDALRTKRFVLLLDEIWDRLDLQQVGIPPVNNQNKSKAVFTTRDEHICGLMNANKTIKINCLEWSNAWSLFRITVGEDVLNSNARIPGLAERVARKCAGLPLALITVGRAMATKRTPQEWGHVLTTMEESVQRVSGMGREVLSTLKVSYDCLDDDVKSCFLYCSLFPKDYLIAEEELIHYWIGEGFLGEGILDEHDTMSSQNHGHYNLSCLKLACLLENGEITETVKMHDLIRGLALWIASEGDSERGKFLVRAGKRLNEVPRVNWREVERISLMDNNIRELSEKPECPRLLTLILKRNSLEVINGGFFQFMRALRVLDLSWNNIDSFPSEIVELMALQYLNLSHTNITELPAEFKSLENLKFLDLSSMCELDMIPYEVISKLSKLQAFNIFDSGFGDWVREGSVLFQGAERLLAELEGSRDLNDLGITLKSVCALEMLQGSEKLQRCTHSLFITRCEGPTTLELSFMRNMQRLKFLQIYKCSDLRRLWISLDGATMDGCFQNLRDVKIEKCWALKDLSRLMFIPSLESLDICDCMNLEEVIFGVSAAVEQIQFIFQGLKYLNLRNLPELKTIYRHALPFPSLGEFKVLSCPRLRELPFNPNSAMNTLKFIKGEGNWWNNLVWDDEATKSTFIPYFRQSGR